MAVKEMNVYGFPISYTDELDLLKKVLKINAVVTNINENENYLRPKLVDVLSFYILLGYSKETKDLILESLSINMKNLNQINSELTRKKYLIRDLHNFKKKHLSEELKSLKKYFIEGESAKIFLIKFKEKT